MGHITIIGLFNPTKEGTKITLQSDSNPQDRLAIFNEQIEPQIGLNKNHEVCVGEGLFFRGVLTVAPGKSSGDLFDVSPRSQLSKIKGKTAEDFRKAGKDIAKELFEDLNALVRFRKPGLIKGFLNKAALDAQAEPLDGVNATINHARLIRALVRNPQFSDAVVEVLMCDAEEQGSARQRLATELRGDLEQDLAAADSADSIANLIEKIRKRWLAEGNESFHQDFREYHDSLSRVNSCIRDPSVPPFVLMWLFGLFSQDGTLRELNPAELGKSVQKRCLTNDPTARLLYSPDERERFEKADNEIRREEVTDRDKQFLPVRNQIANMLKADRRYFLTAGHRMNESDLLELLEEFYLDACAGLIEGLDEFIKVTIAYGRQVEVIRKEIKLRERELSEEHGDEWEARQSDAAQELFDYAKGELVKLQAQPEHRNLEQHLDTGEFGELEESLKSTPGEVELALYRYRSRIDNRAENAFVEGNREQICESLEQDRLSYRLAALSTRNDLSAPAIAADAGVTLELDDEMRGDIGARIRELLEPRAAQRRNEASEMAADAQRVSLPPETRGDVLHVVSSEGREAQLPIVDGRVDTRLLGEVAGFSAADATYTFDDESSEFEGEAAKQFKLDIERALEQAVSLNDESVDGSELLERYLRRQSELIERAEKSDSTRARLLALTLGEALYRVPKSKTLIGESTFSASLGALLLAVSILGRIKTAELFSEGKTVENDQMLADALSDWQLGRFFTLLSSEGGQIEAAGASGLIQACRDTCKSTVEGASPYLAELADLRAWLSSDFSSGTEIDIINDTPSGREVILNDEGTFVTALSSNAVQLDGLAQTWATAKEGISNFVPPVFITEKSIRSMPHLDTSELRWIESTVLKDTGPLRSAFGGHLIIAKLGADTRQHFSNGQRVFWAQHQHKQWLLSSDFWNSLEDEASGPSLTRLRQWSERDNVAPLLFGVGTIPGLLDDNKWSVDLVFLTFLQEWIAQAQNTSDPRQTTSMRWQSLLSAKTETVRVVNVDDLDQLEKNGCEFQVRLFNGMDPALRAVNQTSTSWFFKGYHQSL